MSARRLNPALVTGLLVLALATIFQEGVVTYTSIDSVRPDVILLLTLNWSLLRGVEEGMIWGLVGGIFVDLFSGLPFGTSSAAYVAVAGFTTLTERAFTRAHLLQPVLTAIMATFIYYTIAFVIVSSADNEFFLGAAFVRTVIGVAIFNAIVNPFLYWGIHQLDARLSPVARTSL